MTELPRGATGVTPRVLPLPGTGLTRRRRWVGLGLATAGVAVVTAVLVPLRSTLALESVLLLYLLGVVVVAVIGGLVPAGVAAVSSFLAANFFFTTPVHTFDVEQRDSVIALVVFLLVAVTVAATVDLAARRRTTALRSQFEAEILTRFTTEPITTLSPAELLTQVKRLFGMDSVAVVEQDGSTGRELLRVGPPLEGRPSLDIETTPGLHLVADGPQLFAEDRRLLANLARAVGRAVEGRRLADEAAQAHELAAVDRLRSALLAAVSHDLRTPLAGIKAAVSSLRQDDIAWSEADQREFLATIEESADQLSRLISNLLDMSRLQAGALSVSLRHVALDEVVATSLARSDHTTVTETVPDDLPLVWTDPGLLERVVANLVENAVRHARDGVPVRVVARGAGPDTVELRVIDNGRGIAPRDYQAVFQPFQRLGDHPDDGGVGLGLAIAKGFSDAVGATLTPSTTPGGGLTMTLTIPTAP